MTQAFVCYSATNLKKSLRCSSELKRIFWGTEIRKGICSEEFDAREKFNSVRETVFLGLVECYLLNSQPFNAQEDTGVLFHRNSNSILRTDHQKNFRWASHLWVGRRKEPILGYVPKNDEEKNLVLKGLNITNLQLLANSLSTTGNILLTIISNH